MKFIQEIRTLKFGNYNLKVRKLELKCSEIRTQIFGNQNLNFWKLELKGSDFVPYKIRTKRFRFCTLQNQNLLVRISES